MTEKTDTVLSAEKTNDTSSQRLPSDFTEEMLRDPAQRKEYIQAVLNLRMDQKEMIYPLAFTDDDLDDLSAMGML